MFIGSSKTGAKKSGPLIVWLVLAFDRMDELDMMSASKFFFLCSCVKEGEINVIEISVSCGD